MSRGESLFALVLAVLGWLGGLLLCGLLPSSHAAAAILCVAYGLVTGRTTKAVFAGLYSEAMPRPPRRGYEPKGQWSETPRP